VDGEGEPLHPGADAQPPQAKLALLLIMHERFAALWSGRDCGLLKPKDGNPDGSRIDFALARIARQARWTREEIAALIMVARRQRGDLVRILRHRTYLARTIDRASRGIEP